MPRSTPHQPSTPVHSPPPSRRVSPATRWAPTLLVAALLGLGPAALALGRQTAPATPAPLGEETAAGPLRLSVGEVLAGPEAVEIVAAASPTNQAPREGVTYVLVEVRVENTGDRPIQLDGGDFALVGDAGLPHRFLGVEPPRPAIDGPLEPEEARTGWTVFAAPVDEAGLTLLYDSLSLPGDWADARLALQPDPTPPPAPPPAEPNQAGIDPAAPATLGQPVTTADWQVELLEVVTGADVFPLVDYRTQALGEDDAVGNDADQSTWLALHLRLTAVGDAPAPAFLPANAFAVVDASGQPLPDLITLTPPRPDAAGAYEPGASRDGWVAFDLPLAAGATAVRFLPYPATATAAAPTTEPDPRYLAFG